MPNTHPSKAERRKIQWRNARMRYYARQMEKFKSAGLNSRGLPPRKRHLVPELPRTLHGTERRAAAQQLRRKRMNEAGYTIRGRSLISDQERAWRQFRSELVK